MFTSLIVEVHLKAPIVTGFFIIASLVIVSLDTVAGTLLPKLTDFIRETQDALGRWFYPSQKFRIFFKNNPDSRIGFFLGMESGGDVKFFSPGAPVRPHFSFSHQFSSRRSDGGTRAEKFHITA